MLIRTNDENVTVAFRRTNDILKKCGMVFNYDFVDEIYIRKNVLANGNRDKWR